MAYPGMSRSMMTDRGKHYRPESRASTFDFSDASERSTTSLWDRSISHSNERRAVKKYRRKLHHRYGEPRMLIQNLFCATYCDGRGTF